MIMMVWHLQIEETLSLQTQKAWSALKHAPLIRVLITATPCGLVLYYRLVYHIVINLP